MHRTTLVAVLFSALLTVSAQKMQTVYINGQPVQAVSVTINSKPALQFLTSDLQKTGALTQGGNQNVTSIQGCKGQTLFNGVLKVTLLDAAARGDEFVVTMKAVNATNQTLNPSVDANFAYAAFWLADDKGNSARLSPGKVDSIKDLVPGASLTTDANLSIKNSSGALTFTPTRILWRPDPKEINTKLPWAKLKNMEFKLSCK